MAWLKRVGVAAVFGAVVFIGFLLHLDNATPVPLRLLGSETEPAPVYWWLYAAFASGLVFGALLCSFAHVRGKLAERRLRKTLGQREAELSRLRDASRGTDDAQSEAPGD